MDRTILYDFVDRTGLTSSFLSSTSLGAPRQRGRRERVNEPHCTAMLLVKIAETIASWSSGAEDVPQNENTGQDGAETRELLAKDVQKRQLLVKEVPKREPWSRRCS